MPTLSGAGGGEFTLEQTGIVTCSTPGATIHYNVSSSSYTGTIPTENDPVIASGTVIRVDRTMGIAFKAFKAGMSPSEMWSSDFRITGKLAAGGNHTVALKSNGEVWAWGSNTNGEIGDGTSGAAARTTPTRVRINSSTFLTDVKSIAAGTSHTIALKNDGTVLAWGLNLSGQLGDGTTTQRLYPVAVKLPNGTALTGITRIAAGANHNLALKDDGTVWAWGANASGQVGDGTTTSPKKFATQVKASSSTFLTNVKSIAAGTAHSAVTTFEGAVWTWGVNSSGQLGNNDTKASSFPVQARTATDFIWNAGEIFCGANHTFVDIGGSGLWGWGLNSNGQLGDGTTTSPRKVAVFVRTAASSQLPLGSIKVAAGGTGHSVAVQDWNPSTDKLYNWGLNTSGQLGFGDTTQRPIVAVPLTGAGDAAAGATHTIAAKLDGTVWGWGSNNLGQLAQANTTLIYKTPTQVAGFIIVEGLDDPDGDGLPNWRERELGTNPLSAHSDDDGMPDAWEAGYGLNPLVNEAAADPDGDGFSNLQEYQNGTNPFDYYNGVAFNLTIAEGNGQTGPPSAWLPTALTVHVTNGSGVPLANAPVTFSLGQATGGLSATSGGPPLPSVLVRTDGAGKASIYYQQGLLPDSPSSVVARSGTVISQEVRFSASTADIPTVGLKLWLNAEAGVTADSLGSVSTWADQSAARNSAQADSSSRPRLVAGVVAGKPVIRFPNLLFESMSGTLAVGPATSIFVVASRQSQTNASIIAKDGFFYVGTDDAGNFVTRYGDGVAWNSGASHPYNIALGKFTLLESINDGSSNAFVNGILIESRTDPMAQSAAGFVLGGGRQGDGSGGWQGDVAEILVYARALTDAERITVERYIDRRYACIPPVPVVPANVRSQSGLPDTAIITWDPQQLVTYTIERKPASGGEFTVVGTIESTGIFEDTGLVEGMSYIYRVRGHNWLGASSYSSSTTVTTATWVPPETPLQRLATGSYSASLVIQSTGTVQSWGDRPGDGTGTGRTNALPLSGVEGTVSVTAGDFHAALLKNDATVWMWGRNVEGQLGDGTNSDRTIPTLVPNLGNVTSVKAGGFHTLALRDDGTVLAWGSNSRGQLGNGQTGTNRSVPATVLNLTNVKQIAAGNLSSVALKADGTVWAWGAEQFWPPLDTNNTTPVQIPGLTNIVSIAAGQASGVAVRMDGSVWTWGRGQDGQLGDGVNHPSSFYTATPVRVANISSAVAVASHHHTLVLLRDGTVWAWGLNNAGQIGNGIVSPSVIAPVPVSGLTGVTAITVAYWHSMALRADGTIYTWGQSNLTSGITDLEGSKVPIHIPLSFVDNNANGMDDSWEWNYFGNLNQSAGDDPDGDGLTNLQEYQNLTSPTDYYNGTLPTMAIMSGNNQVADPETFLSEPLVVRVANSQGQPLANAPVTFSTGADGRFSLANDGSGALAYSMSLRTDASGLAATYFRTPPVLNSSMTITATALSGANSANTSFTAGTNDLPLPEAPSNVTVARQADGTTVITWEAAPNVGQGFDVRYQKNDGSWITVGTAARDARSMTIPAQSGLFVDTGNFIVDLRFYIHTLSSPATNPNSVRYAVIDLQKDLALPYYLDPEYLTNDGVLVLWDGQYSYLWNKGQLQDLGLFTDWMDVLENGSPVPMPPNSTYQRIDVWKTRKGVTIGGGYYALGMQEMNRVNGQEVLFNALDINNEGLILGQNASGYFFYSSLLPGQYDYFALANSWWPWTMNHHLLTLTDENGNQVERVSPQVVGRDNHGAVLSTEEPNSGTYQIDYLNRLIPKESGWNLTAAWSINDHGMITAVGTYQANPVGPIQEKACLLFPGVFEARPEKINDGFDPMGSEPWASVGVSGTNEAVQFATSPLLATRLSFSVASGASFVTVSHEVKPQGKIHISLTGTSAGTAVVEAKLDGQVVVGRLRVLILPVRNLRVAIYRVEDSRNSATAIPANPALDQSIIQTLNEVFKQACVTFELEISDYRDWPYDSNSDGVCTAGEWQNSRPNNANGLGGQIRAFLIKQGEPNWGGFSVNKSHPTSPTPGPGGVIFLHSLPERLQIHAAHEFGHALELPVVDTHDPGPYPPGTSGLMAPGEAAAPPGKWLRHQDWERCNSEAGGL